MWDTLSPSLPYGLMITISKKLRCCLQSKGKRVQKVHQIINAGFVLAYLTRDKRTVFDFGCVSSQFLRHGPKLLARLALGLNPWICGKEEPKGTSIHITCPSCFVDSTNIVMTCKVKLYNGWRWDVWLKSTMDVSCRCCNVGFRIPFVFCFAADFSLVLKAVKCSVCGWNYWYPF